MTTKITRKTYPCEKAEKKIRLQLRREPYSSARCYICGAPALWTFATDDTDGDGRGFLPTHRSYCTACAESEISRRIAADLDYHRMTATRAVENGITLLEKQGIDVISPRARSITEYMRAKAFSGELSFGSKYEAAAGFIFALAGLKPQMEIMIATPIEGAPEHFNEVDILIKIEGRWIAVEIDGDLHNGDGEKTVQRDRLVTWHYPDINIIHIDTDYLDSRARDLLHDVTVINRIIEGYRQQNGGTVPENIQHLIADYLIRMNHPNADRLVNHSALYLAGDPYERKVRTPSYNARRHEYIDNFCPVFPFCSDLS